MLKNKVFVSFDFDLDKHYKYLLSAWNANPSFNFIWEDESSPEIQSKDVGRIKAALTYKIKNATHILIIIGKDTNRIHPDHIKIGFRNWQIFEINQAKINNIKIVAVKLSRIFQSPVVLLGANAKWAMSFDEKEIIKALSVA